MRTEKAKGIIDNIMRDNPDVRIACDLIKEHITSCHIDISDFKKICLLLTVISEKITNSKSILSSGELLAACAMAYYELTIE
jgi:hypothetical protein